MNDPSVRSSRGIGWLLFVLGVVAAAGVGLYEFIVDSAMPTWAKLIVAAIYVGLAFLLYSVVRQRIIESRNDRYKDVEI